MWRDWDEVVPYKYFIKEPKSTFDDFANMLTAILQYGNSFEILRFFWRHYNQLYWMSLCFAGAPHNKYNLDALNQCTKALNEFILNFPLLAELWGLVIDETPQNMRRLLSSSKRIYFILPRCYFAIFIFFLFLFLFLICCLLF